MQKIECPYCAGEIPAYVKKCKHCREWIKPPDSQQQVDNQIGETCKGCDKNVIPKVILGQPLIFFPGE